MYAALRVASHLDYRLVTFFCVCGHTADVITRAIFEVDCLTDKGLRVSKIWGFPPTLIVALPTVLRSTVLRCDVKSLKR